MKPDALSVGYYVLMTFILLTVFGIIPALIR